MCGVVNGLDLTTLNPMKIASRLIIVAGFTLILALLLVLALLDLQQMARNQERMETVISQGSVKVDRLNTLRHIARERSMLMIQMLIAEDPFVAGALRDEMTELASKVLGIVAQIRAMQLSPQELTNFTRVLAQASLVAKMQGESTDLIEVGEFATARNQFFKVDLPAQNKLLDIYAEIIEIQRLSADKALEDARQAHRQARISTIALAAGMIIVGLGVATFVIRNTTRIEDNLNTLNKDLEQRVAYRTAALETTNATLQNTIDDLKNAQAQLVQSEKMASLGNLVAGMAHEINTPLGISVTSASSMQLETVTLKRALDAGSMKRSDMTNYLAYIDQNCQLLLKNIARAAALIGSFKLIAVDQASQDWREVNLSLYLHEIIVSLHPRIKKTQVTVHNQCDPNTVMFIDPGILYQIISNLILNSLVHAFDPGVPGNIWIRSTSTAKQVLIEYLDDGKGVASEHINRVFDPFFTTRRGSGGSGLGLNIVYNLVSTTLQGVISLKSSLGAGVIFSIKLPRNRLVKPNEHAAG